MKKKELPKGYACKFCGKSHRYPAYVYAHWDDTQLEHTCECGKKALILNGHAIQERKTK